MIQRTVAIDPDEYSKIEETHTDDIRVTLDDVLTSNKEVVQILIGHRPENRAILRELLMDIYIRGFFTGVRHKEEDNGDPLPEEH